MTHESTTTSPTPANRLGLDYTAEAGTFDRGLAPIIDVHSHINGAEAVNIYRRAAELYGISMTYSMSRLEEVDHLRAAMDGRIRFIAVPDYWSQENRRHNMTDGYADRISAYHAQGARIVKFWVAPRSRDFAIELGEPDLLVLDAPHRVAAMERACELGMMFMAHIADPDTWFQTKYADASVYGSKEDQYEPFERMLDRFPVPWIGAHMGGWPEDLDFLDGLLDRHSNLYLDTSACKWMVRELSKHPRERFVTFLERHRGRILFGSDIVTMDEHLAPASDDVMEMQRKASSPAGAFDLYASRYWALRTLWETEYDGESPIADPDLALVSPDSFDEMDAPPLRGQSVPADLLRSIYHDAAHTLLEPYHTS